MGTILTKQGVADRELTNHNCLLRAGTQRSIYTDRWLTGMIKTTGQSPVYIGHVVYLFQTGYLRKERKGRLVRRRRRLKGLAIYYK